MTTVAQQKVLDAIKAGAELLQGRLQGKFWLQHGPEQVPVARRVAESLIAAGEVKKVGVNEAGARRYR